MNIKAEARNLITALDIGNSNIIALVAEVTQDGMLEVIGIGLQKTSGMVHGIIINSDSLSGAIKSAINTAELMSNSKIKDVYVSISGGIIKSFNANATINIQNRTVAQDDIDQVIDAATSSLCFPVDRRTLHVFQQGFILDGVKGIKNPVGMEGVCLEVAAHIVTGDVKVVGNIEKCLGTCGLNVSGMALPPLAICKAVLTVEDMGKGACLVDMGRLTTKLAIFKDGAICHSAVISIAGDQITNDIAMDLRIPTKVAEDIKIKSGCALCRLADDLPVDLDDIVQQGNAKRITQHSLAKSIEPRMDEVFCLVQAELQNVHHELLGSGIVITGAGCMMRGTVELAEQIFGMPVRIGSPHCVGRLSDTVNAPQFSTAVGLLMHGLERNARQLCTG